MSGPFPGMDPWLVSRWSDFHTTFLVYLRDTITPTLPEDLWAGVEKDVVAEDAEDAEGAEVAEDGERQRMRPDANVRVAEPRAAYAGGSAAGGLSGGGAPAGTATAPRPVVPPTRVLRGDPPVQRSVRIIDPADGGKVVTAIELLSPTNRRRGEGAEAYRAKQRLMAAAGVNLLEIDLLREGECVTLAPREPSERCGFHLSLRNFRRCGDTELHAFGLEDPLPKIALPLRSGDEPLPLDLQEVLDETTARGGYARRFDYAEGPPGPPLPEQDRAWVESRLAAWRAAAA